MQMASESTLERVIPLVTHDIPVAGRCWQVTTVQNENALLDSAHELEHFPFGLLLWEAAVGLAHYLTARPEIVAGRSVLELGAGVGVAGIVAQSVNGRVCQTDHQKPALELARRNAEQNGITGIEQFLADWRSWSHCKLYDVIIGADITYERAMHFYLEEIFARNLAPGGAVLLSDPGRPQSLEFAARLENKGWHILLETLPVPPVENEQAGIPVDIAIMTLTKLPSDGCRGA